MKFKQLIYEDTIGKVADSINVVLNIDKTKHAGERQSRHDHKFITEKDIKDTVNKAIKGIAQRLIFDKIDIGDSIHIHNSKNELNVIGSLENGGNGVIEFVVITVMIKRNFKGYVGQTTIKV